MELMHPAYDPCFEIGDLACQSLPALRRLRLQARHPALNIPGLLKQLITVLYQTAKFWNPLRQGSQYVQCQTFFEKCQMATPHVTVAWLLSRRR